MNLDVIFNWSAIEKLVEPFYRIFTASPQQWHPLVVHFPFVFLLVEFSFLLIFFIRRKIDFEKKAYAFLKAGFWSIFIVAAAGIHDCGLNMGSGNKFLLGLEDRWENKFNFESTITVHLWLALFVFAITVSRFLWRRWKGSQLLQGKGGWAYGFLVLIGVWSLFAMSYVGGSVSHN